tara:strand:+ start:445 stop:558 length:114 start_codon:yes stop_codon:yes gene_type:complete
MNPYKNDIKRVERSSSLDINLTKIKNINLNNIKKREL